MLTIDIYSSSTVVVITILSAYTELVTIFYDAGIRYNKNDDDSRYNVSNQFIDTSYRSSISAKVEISEFPGKEKYQLDGYN